ncbi:MAG: NDP-sugar synthase, partial [Methanimicrococcus sp.]|nr:NDP-sugar synthase [Methanimicrococcus sp.]
IGKNSTLSGAIVDSDSNVGARCSLENGTIVGPRSVIHDGVTIHSGVKLWPETVIEKDKNVKEDVLNEKYDTNVSGS